MGAYEQVGKLTDSTAEAIRSGSKQMTKAATAFATNVKKQRELEKVRVTKLNESLYGLDLAVESIPQISDSSLDDNTRKVLEGQLGKIHALGLEASKTGDNAFYLKERAKFEALVKQLPVMIGVLNEEAKTWETNNQKGVKFLNNPEYNDAWKMDMLDNFNDKDGEDIIPSIVNGKWVFKYKGNLLNTENNLKNVEKGGGLIKYAGDPTSKFKSIFEVAAGEDYTGKQVSTQEKEGSKITTTQKQDYTEQNEQIRDMLSKDDGGLKDEIQGVNGQDNWQHYGGEGSYDPEAEIDWNGKKAKMKDILKDLIIEDMIQKYGHEDIIEKGSSERILTNKEKKELPDTLKTF